MSSFLGFLSFFCILCAYVPLWGRIILGWRQPREEREPLPRVTWLLWLYVDLALALPASGVLALQMWAYVAGSLFIASCAFVRGNSRWSHETTVVFVLGVAAIIARFFVEEEWAASVLLVAAASVGALELCERLWHHPRAQGLFAWILFWIGGFAGLFALPSWSTAGAVAPAGFLIVQSIILAIVFRRALQRLALAVFRLPRRLAVAEEADERPQFRLAA